MLYIQVCVCMCVYIYNTHIYKHIYYVMWSMASNSELWDSETRTLSQLNYKL